MTEGTKTALWVGGGIAALFLLAGSKPRTTSPIPVGYPSGTGGNNVATITGGVVSIVDSITGALAGQQTGGADYSSFGF